MLTDLQRKYESAAAQYDDYQKKQTWDLLRGEVRNYSWEDVKATKERTEMLFMEKNRWMSLLNGRSFEGAGSDVNQFVRGYVTFRVSRIAVTPTPTPAPQTVTAAVPTPAIPVPTVVVPTNPSPTPSARIADDFSADKGWWAYAGTAYRDAQNAICNVLNICA